jgi:hypothetical protein
LHHNPTTHIFKFTALVDPVPTQTNLAREFGTQGCGMIVNQRAVFFSVGLKYPSYT